MGRHARLACIDAATITVLLGRAPGDDADSMRHVAVMLDEIEAAHDIVLLPADAAATAWTSCCARQGDELLLLAHADDEACPGAVEQACGLVAERSPEPRRPASTTVLVLQHDTPAADAGAMPPTWHAWPECRAGAARARCCRAAARAVPPMPASTGRCTNAA
jgi:NTE family protein